MLQNYKLFLRKSIDAQNNALHLQTTVSFLLQYLIVAPIIAYLRQAIFINWQPIHISDTICMKQRIIPQREKSAILMPRQSL